MSKKYIFDLDDTILYSRLMESKRYEISHPNTELIEIIQDLYKKENQIIIHTARHWNHLEQTQNQLAKYSVPYDTLVMGKPTGDYYIDDKGVTPEQFIKTIRGNKNE